MRTRAGLIAAIIIVILGAVGLRSSLRRVERPSQETRVQATLGCERSLLTAPVWVALDQGFFQENGVNLTVKEFDSGKASLAAMLAGELDLCTVAQTPIMFNSFDRNDFVIISLMVNSYTDMKVIGRRERGVLAAQDLEGKRVGITEGSTGQFFLYLVLLHHGVSPTTVETVDTEPSDLPHALIEGSVDAICTWEPHALAATTALGDGAVTLGTEDLYREDFYFVARRDFLEAKSHAASRFLEAIENAQKLIADREEEAKTIVSRRLGLDRAQVDTLWGGFDFELGLDQTVLVTLEDEARWAIQEGLAGENTRIPNYLDYISCGPLDSVKPKSIRIIR